MRIQSSTEKSPAGAKAALSSSAGDTIAEHPYFNALIDEGQCQQISGLSRTERWRRIQAGSFPAPVSLGRRCTRWSLIEVLAWVNDRLAEREAS